MSIATAAVSHSDLTIMLDFSTHLFNCLFYSQLAQVEGKRFICIEMETGAYFVIVGLSELVLAGNAIKMILFLTQIFGLSTNTALPFFSTIGTKL